MSKGNTAGSRFLAISAIFFGLGFVLGFITCYGYVRANSRIEIFKDPPAAPRPRSADRSEPGPLGGEEAETAHMDIELSLEDHFLGNDSGGTYIAGVIANDANHPFDAVRVEFDLHNAEGKAYGSITETLRETLGPGEIWEFTIYIPYTRMDRFAGYKLRSIMGVTR